MRTVRLLALISLALAAVALICILIFLRPAAVYACPTCFGLKSHGDGVYIDESASTEDVVRFQEALRSGRALVTAYYSELTTDPVLLACKTSACEERIGAGGARATAYGDVFAVITSRGWSSTILAHELAHIELHARIGTAAQARGALPAWFDEGLAVLISKDDRYMDFASPDAPKCRHPASISLPTSNQEWGREAGRKTRPIYAMAACRTQAWLDAHSGRDGLYALIAKLKGGGAFQE